MATITATPQPDGSVALLVDAGAPSSQLLALTRSDDRGRAAVRLPAGLADSFEAMTLEDHECALTGSLEYEAEIRTGTTTTTVATTTTVEPLIAPHTWFIHPAVLPEDRVSVTFVDWMMTREARSTETPVIGRPAPVVNRAALATREGPLEVYLPAYDAVRALEALSAAGETLMIRQNDFPGLDGYFELRRISPTIVRETARPGDVKWWCRLELVEVDAPSGPLLVASDWTMRDALERFPTFRISRDAFPTYRDLLIGPAPV